MQISFRRNSRHLLNRKLSFSRTLVNPVTKISSTWYFRFSLVTQWGQWVNPEEHYDDVIMDAIASQITSLTIVYSNVYSGADQSKHQSSASLAFVWGIHRGPVNSPHKWPVTRKMFPFDDVIMIRRSKVGLYTKPITIHKQGARFECDVHTDDH